MYIEGTIPNRQEDEKLLLFLRRHWIILLGKWILYILLGLIPIAIYYFLLYAFPFLITNEIYYSFLLLLTSIYYLFMILFFFNAFIDYHLDVWIVTSKRIIDIEQKGLFNRVISEQTIDKVQDVTAVQKGFFETFFNYGTVIVQTAGKLERFSFHQVPLPFDIVKTINGLVQREEDNLEHEIHEILHHENNK
ncbi:MAG: PH domain-containing protein [Patescibacteria group bacterium]|nr:PH domain-containing protein [Patescibacteria group bacterium]